MNAVLRVYYERGLDYEDCPVRFYDDMRDQKEPYCGNGNTGGRCKDCVPREKDDCECGENVHKGLGKGQMRFTSMLMAKITMED